MGFTQNLQYLRSSRNLTQERLAMLLGVSRQAISKWESGKAYPEMDKLLVICDVFGCSLDDLVMGDVRGLQSTSSSERLPVAAPAEGSVEDMVGYGDHMRRFALHMTLGIFSMILGIAAANLFDSENSIIGKTPLNEFLMPLCVFIGVAIGLALLIPTGMGHVDFKRRHPFIEDFYTNEDRSRASRQLAFGVVGGLIAVIAGVLVMVYCSEVLGVSDGWPVAIMLSCGALGVGSVIYFGIMHSSLDIEKYNATDEHGDVSESNRDAYYNKLTGAVCGIIMMISTIVGLWILFTGDMPSDATDWSNGWGSGHGLFWLAWVIGGLCCAIASILIQMFKEHKER